MDNNNRFIEELRSLLRLKFNNDIDKLAKCIGRPVKDVQDFMDGQTPIPPGFVEDLTECLSKKCGENKIQFGDKYIEINNTGDGYTNNYEGMMKGAQIDIIKKMKLEMSELKKSVKSKDEILESKDETIKSLKEITESYEEIIKSKDEIIDSLKETIEMLKKKQL